MRTRRHLLSEDDSTRDVWPAFTDVMSTMALILFVLVLLAYVRTLITGKHLDGLQRLIATSEQKLRTMNADLRRASAELRASEDKRYGQERIIEDTNRQLAAVRTQLESVAVLRVEVLSKLKDAIEAELGKGGADGGPLVSFGENGNIVINENLVFEVNSFAVKREAYPLLASLATALGNLLDDPGVRENIDAIVVEGHTDERGSTAFNWDLSAKRATAVIDVLFTANGALSQSYGRYFTASAHSKFRPISAERTPGGYQRNRRIEISVIPKDASVRKVIDAYLHSTSMTAPISP